MNIRIHKKLARILIIFFLLIGIGLTVFIINERQDLRQRAACVAESASCEWDPVEGAATYHYKITVEGSDTPLKEGDVTAPTTRVTFTPVIGQTYTCEVYAVNSCEEVGPSGQITQTCSDEVNPTPTPTLTLTPTAFPTVTPIVSLTPTDSPEPTATPTPTATPIPTNTPAPTSTPVPTNTPTIALTELPTPTVTPTPNEFIETPVTATPTPTIPPTGNNTTNIGLALGAVVAVLGFLFFFAL